MFDDEREGVLFYLLTHTHTRAVVLVCADALFYYEKAVHNGPCDEQAPRMCSTRLTRQQGEVSEVCEMIWLPVSLSYLPVYILLPDSAQ